MKIPKMAKIVYRQLPTPQELPQQIPPPRQKLGCRSLSAGEIFGANPWVCVCVCVCACVCVCGRGDSYGKTWQLNNVLIIWCMPISIETITQCIYHIPFTIQFFLKRHYHKIPHRNWHRHFNFHCLVLYWKCCQQFQRWTMSLNCLQLSGHRK